MFNQYHLKKTYHYDDAKYYDADQIGYMLSNGFSLHVTAKGASLCLDKHQLVCADLLCDPRWAKVMVGEDLYDFPLEEFEECLEEFD